MVRERSYSIRRATRLLGLMLISTVIFGMIPVQSRDTFIRTKPNRESTQPAGTRFMRNEKFGFAIHGGAGTIVRNSMTPELEKEYRAKLNESLLAGYEILKHDGTSLDAVEAAITIMEDSPLFNAGKGAVYTSDGSIELDASIMDGKTLKAGAVAAVRHIKNPIRAARLVMEQSPNVLMVGEGAEAFAREKGIELVPVEYFQTTRRWQELQRAKEKENRETEQPKKSGHNLDKEFHDVTKYGTVGAVALDKQGNLAAGTSTGGKTNKKFGRVGDSPIIGAGTYANNRTCAVSGTGDGEYFMRGVLAYDVSAMMEYKDKSLSDASRIAIEKMGKLGGFGGLIGIDRDGNIAMPFNSEGMYRGYIGVDGKVVIVIYKD